MEINSISSYAAQTLSVAAKIREEQAAALNAPQVSDVNVEASSDPVCPECGQVHAPGQGHAVQEKPSLSGLSRAPLVAASAVPALQEESTTAANLDGLAVGDPAISPAQQGLAEGVQDPEAREQDQGGQVEGGRPSDAAPYAYRQEPVNSAVETSDATGEGLADPSQQNRNGVVAAAYSRTGTTAESANQRGLGQTLGVQGLIT